MKLIDRGEGINGCSGGVSPMWKLFTGRRPRFEWCCDEHDLAYDEGGDAAYRGLSDRRLRQCVAESGHPAFAWIMWAGVRLFSWPFWDYREHPQ